VRLVSDLVKKKNVKQAVDILAHTNKRASLAIKKAIESATTNAVQNFGLNKENLIIQNITVDEGATLRRYRPRSHGSSYRIRKRTSAINVTLAEVNPERQKKIKPNNKKIKSLDSARDK
jgi:large subunit ribosomal protein L22